MSHKYTALNWERNSAPCDSIAVGTVQGFPHFALSLSVLTEHFITHYCKKKKKNAIQTYQFFTWLAKIDPLLLSSMAHSIKTSSEANTCHGLVQGAHYTAALHCIMALGDWHKDFVHIFWTTSQYDSDSIIKHNEINTRGKKSSIWLIFLF
jgi:hypothetical protein